MATTNETARSGKIETLGEVLERIQRMKTEWYTLVTEHFDWLVVLQCLQDNGLFKRNPKQPPLKEFAEWLTTQNVPQYIAKCTVRTMSYANNMIAGARYPWNEVTWNPHVIRRWRILYETLDKWLKDRANVIASSGTKCV